jgi:predicted Zn-dependent protease
MLFGLGWTVLLSPGCKVIESTGDTLAKATEGTAASSLFSGMARAAESMRDYSPAEEHYIGRSVAAQILSQYTVLPDASLQEYVNLVGLSVLAAPEPRKTLTGYHFIVLEGQEVQAVSTPGGFVFLTEGAVRKAKDEDELAAVLAHEIAHVSLNHGIGAIKAATRKKSFGLLAQSAGQVAQAAAAKGSARQQDLAQLATVFGDAVQDITGQLLVKGYSRETELEADKKATVYLQSSGYARAALASYLRSLGGAGGKGGWFATHPSPNDRIQELGDLATGASPWRPLRADRFGAIVRK